MSPDAVLAEVLARGTEDQRALAAWVLSNSRVLGNQAVEMHAAMLWRQLKEQAT